MRTIRYPRSAMAALVAGLALTLVALLAPYASGTVLADHIRAGYPSYDAARIDTAATTYLVYLSVVGALGVLGWLGTLWAAGRRKPWARWVATGLFAVGTSVALFDLLVRDTSGDTGLPPLLGWLGLLPCLAGIAALALLWRRRPQRVGA
ncbi:MAG TPA: hypothetical protein VGN37_13580 [Actinocatenispora sp.]